MEPVVATVVVAAVCCFCCERQFGCVTAAWAREGGKGEKDLGEDRQFLEVGPLIWEKV